MGQNLGDSFWIEAIITDENDRRINPDSHEVRLLDSRGTERDKETSPAWVSVGRFKAKLKIPKIGPTGLWKVEWIVYYGTDQETEIYPFVVHKT